MSYSYTPATLEKLIRIAGGARITFKGHTFFAKDTITINLTPQTFGAATQFGPVQPLLQRRMATITFTPYGDVSTGSMLALFNTCLYKSTGGDNNTVTSWGAVKPGDILYPKAGTGTGVVVGSDNECGDLVIDPLKPTTGQVQWKFYRCECLRPPDLYFGVTKTRLGQVTITAFGKLEDTVIASPTAVDNHLFTQSAAGSAPTDFVATLASMDRCVLSGSATGFTDDMYAQDGFTFSIDPSVEELPVDGFAVPTVMVTEVRARIACRIGNLTDTQIAGLLDMSAGAGGLGSPITGALQTWTLRNTADTRKIVLNDGRPLSMTPAWELRSARSGDLSIENVRQWTTGALNNVFTLTWA